MKRLLAMAAVAVASAALAGSIYSPGIKPRYYAWGVEDDPQREIMGQYEEYADLGERTNEVRRLVTTNLLAVASLFDGVHERAERFDLDASRVPQFPGSRRLAWLGELRDLYEYVAALFAGQAHKTLAGEGTSPALVRHFGDRKQSDFWPTVATDAFDAGLNPNVAALPALSNAVDVAECWPTFRPWIAVDDFAVASYAARRFRLFPPLAESVSNAIDRAAEDAAAAHGFWTNRVWLAARADNLAAAIMAREYDLGTGHADDWYFGFDYQTNSTRRLDWNELGRYNATVAEWRSRYRDTDLTLVYSNVALRAERRAGYAGDFTDASVSLDSTNARPFTVAVAQWYAFTNVQRAVTNHLGVGRATAQIEDRIVRFDADITASGSYGGEVHVSRDQGANFVNDFIGSDLGFHITDEGVPHTDDNPATGTLLCRPVVQPHPGGGFWVSVVVDGGTVKGDTNVYDITGTIYDSRVASFEGRFSGTAELRVSASCDGAYSVGIDRRALLPEWWDDPDRQAYRVGDLLAADAMLCALGVASTNDYTVAAPSAWSAAVAQYDRWIAKVRSDLRRSAAIRASDDWSDLADLREERAGVLLSFVQSEARGLADIGARGIEEEIWRRGTDFDAELPAGVPVKVAVTIPEGDYTNEVSEIWYRFSDDHGVDLKLGLDEDWTDQAFPFAVVGFSIVAEPLTNAVERLPAASAVGECREILRNDFALTNLLIRGE